MYIYNTEDIQLMSPNINKRDFSQRGSEVQADDRYYFKSRQLQIKYFTHYWGYASASASTPNPRESSRLRGTKKPGDIVTNTRWKEKEKKKKNKNFGLRPLKNKSSNNAELSIWREFSCGIAN